MSNIYNILQHIVTYYLVLVQQINFEPESESGIMTTKTTRSTRRAQTSLAEADHYSHIAHCKNVEPWF